ncbi:unnamed protein product, partial [Mesorhabditis spiculigera]
MEVTVDMVVVGVGHVLPAIIPAAIITATTAMEAAEVVMALAALSHHVFCPQSYGLLDPLDALRYASTRNCSIGLPKWPSYIPVENQRRQVLEALVGEEKIHYYCPFRTFFCDGVWVNGSKMANATAMGCYNFKTVGMVTNRTLSTCHCEPQEGKEPLLVEPVHPSLSGAALVYKKDFATCGWKIQLRQEDLLSATEAEAARHGTMNFQMVGKVTFW